MARPSRKKIARALLDRHGQTFAEELKIHVEKNTPAPLFQMLVASLLMSTRISADAAKQATKALFKTGWRTPQKMADATWEQRVRVLNRSGYARYDESTSRMLGDTCGILLEKYAGDLRKLRDAAERDPQQERKRLKEFKGIGEVGADIFFREVQVAWDELRPFVDQRALETAERLGLPGDPEQLAKLVEAKDFPRLVAALVRTRLAKDGDAVIEAAG
ncbi:MAG: hypothetical protein ACLFV3_01110 [Phycisphaeraceae bacterium]